MKRIILVAISIALVFIIILVVWRLASRDEPETQEPDAESVDTNDLPTTYTDLSLYSSSENCYVIADEKVYDVTEYAKDYEGQSNLLGFCGQDISGVLDDDRQPVPGQEYLKGLWADPNEIEI